MKDIFICAGVFIIGIFLLVFTIRFVVKKSYVLINGILGLLGLLLVNSLSGITNLYLSNNILNYAVSFFLGLPGVAFMLLEKLI